MGNTSSPTNTPTKPGSTDHCDHCSHEHPWLDWLGIILRLWIFHFLFFLPWEQRERLEGHEGDMKGEWIYPAWVSRSHSDCWNITILHTKYIFKGSIFQPAMLDYRSVTLNCRFVYCTYDSYSNMHLQNIHLYITKKNILHVYIKNKIYIYI